MQAVNRELIDLYWNLERLITERQEQHGWGKRVVENLSKELQLELPGESGLPQISQINADFYFDSL